MWVIDNRKGRAFRYGATGTCPARETVGISLHDKQFRVVHSTPYAVSADVDETPDITDYDGITIDEAGKIIWLHKLLGTFGTDDDARKFLAEIVAELNAEGK